MPDQNDEVDLRRAFAALRADDARQVPPFRAEPSATGGPRWAPGLGGLLAAATLVGAILLTIPRPPAPVPSPIASLDQWTAPTDFLLRTPGREILESVPRIGARAAFPSLPGLAESSPLPKQRSVSP